VLDPDVVVRADRAAGPAGAPTEVHGAPAVARNAMAFSARGRFAQVALFAVLGVSEAQTFLADKPVSFIFGVGKVNAARLARDGFHRIADLQCASEVARMRRYGEERRRLARLARGIDPAR
jgi:nucleotidyltransferase/DNA polymerase involved in DNA repair